jgi:hypothetical protein
MTVKAIRASHIPCLPNIGGVGMSRADLKTAHRQGNQHKVRHRAAAFLRSFVLQFKE